jgi:hypothetical protein
MAFFAVKAAVGIDGTLKIMPGVIVTPDSWSTEEKAATHAVAALAVDLTKAIQASAITHSHPAALRLRASPGNVPALQLLL